MDIEYRAMDQQIWEEELAEWVPDRLYDVHQHVYKVTDPDCPGKPLPARIDEHGIVQGTVGLDVIREWDRTLLPGRMTEYFLMGSPSRDTKPDAEDHLQFVAAEAAREPLTTASMLVTPQTQPEWLAEQLDRYGFVGLKPYRTFTADPVNCRITDMIPEPLLAVANDRGLLVTLHLGKERALADPENIEDLRRLSPQYPRIRWILPHCARCFAPWAAEKSFAQIKDLPNIWYDISAVCSAEVMDLLLATVASDRIMYGSDSCAGWVRGKYVWWGYTWEWMKEGLLKTTHADWHATFVLYEQLRALGYALRNQKWDKQKIEDLFYNNAMKLIHGDTMFFRP